MTSSMVERPMRRPAEAGPARLAAQQFGTPQKFIGKHKFGLLCLLVYGLLVGISFGKTFQCGFLADDYVALAELKHFDLLATLISPWQSTNFQTLYRPLSQLSLFGDHFLWGANATGFHATNLMLHTFAAVILALSVRYIGKVQDIGQPNAMGFVTGLIFAVSPLHCESIIWITGRVDLLATLFTLTAFWCFLRSYHENSPRHQMMLPVAFALAALSKESAVVLPLVSLLYAGLLPRNGENLRERSRLALALLVPTFFTAALLLACRYVVLGTPGGGYLGMSTFDLGETLQRFDGRTLWRLFYPFNSMMVSDNGAYSLALRTFYVLVSVRIILNLSAYASNPIYFRLIAFSVSAFCICLLPVIPVAHLSSDALGSRFFYMSGAWLALYAAVMLVPVDPTRLRQKALAAATGTLLIVAYVTIRMQVTVENSTAWVEASQRTETLRKQVTAVVAALPVAGKLLFVNPPRQHRGAHMCYNATMLSAILGPGVGERVLSLQPRYFWNKDPVSMVQLAQFARRKDIAASYVDRSDLGQSQDPHSFAAPSSSISSRRDSATCILCDSEVSDAGSIDLGELPTKFRFDVAGVKGGAGICIQLSKPDQSFGLYDWRACLREIRLAGSRGEFWLTRHDVLVPGLYEIRFAATDASGGRLEEMSDALVLVRQGE